MTTVQLAFVVATLSGLAVILVVLGLANLRPEERPEERLERLSASESPTEQAELEEPFTERIFKPWLRQQVRAAGRLAPSRDIEKIQLQLVQAGFPHRLTVMDFLGLKLLAAITCAGAGLIVSRSLPLGKAFITATGWSVSGFLAPDFWLKSIVKKRRKELSRTLPDALDMLTICVDAGAGLDSAMLKISQKWDNAIADEFGKVVGEVGIGLTRREALQNLATRTDLPEIGSFVAVLHQADQFGLSIANVLHTQSDQMRVLRRQRAEEEARKVPIKLLFPLVFMVFPSMLAVTIGPAIPVLMKSLAGITR